jgi:catalase
VEQAHIAAAFRFELSKVTVPAIRERTVSMLRNASEELARKVAEGLGMDPLPDAMPLALARPAKPEVTLSPTLSLMARLGDGGIKARKIALLIAPGVLGESIAQVQAALLAEGAVPRLVAPRIGPIATAEHGKLHADASLENEPGFLFDALVLPDGQAAVDALAKDGHTMEFIKDQYRHGKTILVLGASSALLDKAGVPTKLPDGKPDVGLIISPSGSAADAAANFIKAIALHRHPQRETDPPRV